jgi:hypothetical protein
VLNPRTHFQLVVFFVFNFIFFKVSKERERDWQLISKENIQSHTMGGDNNNNNNNNNNSLVKRNVVQENKCNHKNTRHHFLRVRGPTTSTHN